MSSKRTWWQQRGIPRCEVADEGRKKHNHRFREGEEAVVIAKTWGPVSIELRQCIYDGCGELRVKYAHAKKKIRLEEAVTLRVKSAKDDIANSKSSKEKL